MSRYRGPRLRIVRRLKEKPGLTRKTPRRDYPPGQHVPIASIHSEHEFAYITEVLRAAIR